MLLDSHSTNETPVMRMKSSVSRVPHGAQEEATMESVQTLLNQIVDYSGLFPPAQLDMPDVVNNYKNYLACPDAWMLGRLIVPVARLDEFEQYANALLPNQQDDLDPWAISAVASPAGTEEFSADLDRIAAFNEQHEDPGNGFAQIDVIELKGEQTSAIERALDEIPDELFPFFEMPVNEDPRGLIAALAGSEAGAKVRTGGLSPEIYPTADQLARFIVSCAGAGVAYKATAALHHPTTYDNQRIGAREFGFFNVFMAGCLAEKFELDVDQIIQVLETSSLDDFRFEPTSVAWQDYALSSDEIEDVRECFAISFGSCSFDEPRQYLREANLL